jgi:hypothetical protein
MQADGDTRQGIDPSLHAQLKLVSYRIAAPGMPESDDSLARSSRASSR